MRGQIRDEKGVLLGKRVNIGSKMSEIILKTEKAEHTKQDQNGKANDGKY